MERELYKGTRALEQRQSKTKAAGCVLDMSSVEERFFFKTTHEIPSEVTGKCPSESAQGKIRPVIFSFPEKPLAL